MQTTIPKIFPHPVMASGGMDYAEGHRYETKQLVNDPGDRGAVLVEHRVTGENLVTQMLKKGQAAFSCTITASSCAYRRVFVSDKTLEETQDGVVVQQRLEFVTDDFGHPIMFQPAVMVTVAIDPFEAQESHGLNGIWLGEKIQMPKAAIIATGPFWKAENEIESILKIRVAPEGKLPPGCYQVEAVPEQGFYFEVLVSPDLFEGLKQPGKSFQHRESIYAAALAQGLVRLHQEYEKREEWSDQSNLRLLYSMLKQKNAPTWDEEDFDANRANRAVALCHPHRIDVTLGVEDAD